MEAPATPILRDYQEAAVAAVFDWIYTKEGWPLVCMATGSGKSITMAKVVHDILGMAKANGVECNVLSVAMQSELIQQNAKALALYNDKHDIGIYNAKLKQRELRKPITVASIQSLASRAYDKAFDVVVVDEVHQLADGMGQYRTFLAAQKLQNPQLLVIGFTATPYKLSSGRLDKGKDALFAGIAYETDILSLIGSGWLTRPVTPKLAHTIDVSGVHLRGGEYIAKELAEAVDVDAITNRAVDEMIARGQDRTHWVAFACTVEHARNIAHALTERGVVAAVVHGELPSDERAYRLQAFDRGEIRCLVSVNLLSTGWDCIHVDLISLLRPTKSAGLYVQFLGRGMRVAPGKKDCLILDHCGLVELFGPIDAIVVRDKKESDGTGDAVVKVCPSCESYQPSGVRLCRECGHDFGPPPVALNAAPSTAAILSSDIEPVWHTVDAVDYTLNPPKKDKIYPTLRVAYKQGYRTIHSEFVCVEHPEREPDGRKGFARGKAEAWWRERSPEECPFSVNRALDLADDLRVPTAIALLPQKKNPQYFEVVQYRFADDHKRHAQLGLPRVCWSCGWFDALVSHCARWDGTPDEATHAVGCPEWKDDDVQLPF